MFGLDASNVEPVEANVRSPTVTTLQSEVKKPSCSVFQALPGSLVLYFPQSAFVITGDVLSREASVAPTL